MENEMENETETRMNYLFENYDLSKTNGFLPHGEPLKKLPDAYSQWDQIAYDLPTLLKNHTIRQTIENLPILDATLLETKEEYKRAYSILTMIVHAYIWDEKPISLLSTINEDKLPPQALPKSLSLPLIHICKKLGLPLVLTHASVDLFNWQLIDPYQPFSLDNIKSTHTFTDTIDEQWFYLVMVAIEQEGAPVISLSQKLVRMMSRQNKDGVEKCLEKMSVHLENMTKILRRIREKCDPKFFYHKLRRFLGGYQDTKLFPMGLQLEGLPDTYIKYTGGSAAQSSLIQLIDIIFDVDHKTPSVKAFLKDMHQYMPEAHRVFLQQVKLQYQESSLKRYVEKHNEEKLTSLYNLCLQHLEDFRKAHMGVVHTYIIPFLEKKAHNDAQGTGGTKLNEFLGETIKDTHRAQLSNIPCWEMAIKKINKSYLFAGTAVVLSWLWWACP